jgi:polygalacturonase
MQRLTRRELIRLGFVLCGGLTLGALTDCVPQRPPSGQPLAWPSPAATASPPPDDLPWREAKAIVAATTVPSFPDRFVFVTDPPYSARPDGLADSTQAFKRAIEGCSSDGGGHVIVPAGVYSLGAVHLLDGVDLHLDQGATLVFSGNVADYPLVLTRYGGIECVNHSPMIYAYRQTNIALTGEGVLDASNTRSWNVGADVANVLEPLVTAGVPPEKRIVPEHGTLRSSFVEPYQCTNVLLQGVTLRQSQFWQIHPTLCRNVTIDSVTTGNTRNYNTDSCNPDCCDHVFIKNCSFDGDDDSIAIKSGKDDDGRRVNTPCQNIVIYRCRVQGRGGGIACGSDMTGGVRNVYAYDVQTFGHSTVNMLSIKSNTRRGGYVENVNLHTIRADHLSGPWLSARMNYEDQTGSYPPVFADWTMSNVTGDSDPMVLDLNGLPGDEIRNVVLENANFTNIASPQNVYHDVADPIFRDVTINGHTVAS